MNGRSSAALVGAPGSVHLELEAGVGVVESEEVLGNDWHDSGEKHVVQEEGDVDDEEKVFRLSRAPSTAPTNSGAPSSATSSPLPLKQNHSAIHRGGRGGTPRDREDEAHHGDKFLTTPFNH